MWVNAGRSSEDGELILLQALPPSNNKAHQNVFTLRSL